MLRFLLPVLLLFADYVSAENWKVAAGLKKGTYFSMAQSFSVLKGETFEVSETAGTADNIRLVASGAADIGFAQMDIFANSYLYNGQFKESTAILLVLYPEEVHLVCRNEIHDFNALTGKTLNIGADFSGTRGTSQILLGTLGFDETKVKLDRRGTDAAWEDIKAGKLDAMFLVAGSPFEMIRQAPADFASRYRILSMSGATYQLLTGGFFPYKKTVVPAGTYSWQPEEVRTISIYSALIIPRKMPEEKVKKLLSAFISARGALKGKKTKWNYFNTGTVREMLQANPQFFHPAAEQFWTDRKD